MAPHVNGDMQNATHRSAFIQHLLDYPVISDGIHTFKSNEYGQRSLRYGDSAYRTFAVPVLSLLSKPYEYVSPYVSTADNYGDKTLQRLDERFPAVKKPTDELYADTKGLILLPYNKAAEGRNHVYDVYSSEVKKNGQSGYLGYGKAAVLTALVVSNETLTWLSNFLSAKKAETNHVVNEKMNRHSRQNQNRH